MRGKYIGLEDELEVQCDNFNTSRKQSNKDFNELEAKYDCNTVTDDDLKQKYELLKNSRSNNNVGGAVGVGGGNYDNLNAHQVVKLIINFDLVSLYFYFI